jgi:hypothetical protein
MIPFSVMEQAKLDITKLKFVEEAEAEHITRKTKRWDSKKQKDIFYNEQVHFTGAKLFEVDGTQFLFDLDRREVKHRIFNPFLVKLPRKVASIAEAYESLKPKQVLAAEKRGIEVLRQGEWFFIKAKAPKLKKLSKHEQALAILGTGSLYGTASEFFTKQYGKKTLKKLLAQAKHVADSMPRAMTLQAGPNRPNRAELGLIQNGISYVTGKVSHTGREHADLHLDGWYVAVANTAQESFTVTGDVD